MKPHASIRTPFAMGAALLAGLAGQAAIAQSTIHYSENFDSVCADGSPGAPFAPPAGFIVHNVDGRTPAANVGYVSSAWIVREDFNFGPTTNCAMFSTSWYEPAGAADDWAVLPVQVTPTATTWLRWEAVAYDPAFRDGYEVRYSTAGTSPADFLANAPLFSISAENTAWTARGVPLAAQAGTPIHLAFRNNSSDKFLLLVDDIEVVEVTTHDPALVAVSQSPTGGYSRLPAFLGYAFDLGAEIRNNGSDPLTGVVVDADVLRDDMLEAAVSSVPVSLAAGATQSVALDSHVYLSPGSWTVEATVQAVEGDQDAANSSASVPLAEVTTSELARWEGAFTGTLGIGGGNGGEMGTVFDLPAMARVAAMQYSLDNTDVDPAEGIGDFNGYALQMTLRAWDAGASTPGELIHTAQTTVAADAAIGPLLLQFPVSGVVLPAGRYVVSAVEPTTPEPRTLTTHQADGRFEPGSMWVTSPSLPWTAVEDVGPSFEKAFVISVFLEPAVVLPLVEDDAFSVAPGGALAGSVAGNDTPSDNGGNVWTLVQEPETGMLQFAPDGSFAYLADAQAGGTTVTFTYQLCDAEADCATATVTVTILPEAIFSDSFE